jgi:hypothetical protein
MPPDLTQTDLDRAKSAQQALLSWPDVPGAILDEEGTPLAIVSKGSGGTLFYKLTNTTRELLRAAGTLPWRP